MTDGNRPWRVSRRSVVAGVAGLVSLSGCFGLGEDSPGDRTEAGTTTTDSNDTTTTAEATTTLDGGTGTDVDLREANVMEVEFESVGASTYRFDVTLLHDDEGESGYADWWQVEDLDGNKLGRRTLLHAHGTRPFTRSERIEVPSGVTCVVVRGHDETHGYGGRVVVVSLESGAIESIDQGPERTSVESGTCP